MALRDPGSLVEQLSRRACRLWTLLAWFHPAAHAVFGKEAPSLFSVPADTHMPADATAFCIDYCVGGRYRERQLGLAAPYQTRLAALRYPERCVCFDGDEPVRPQRF